MMEMPVDCSWHPSSKKKFGHRFFTRCTKLFFFSRDGCDLFRRIRRRERNRRKSFVRDDDVASTLRGIGATLEPLEPSESQTGHLGDESNIHKGRSDRSTRHTQSVPFAHYRDSIHFSIIYFFVDLFFLMILFLSLSVSFTLSLSLSLAGGVFSLFLSAARFCCRCDASGATVSQSISLCELFFSVTWLKETRRASFR